jgi:hypothetical protein
VGSSSSTTKPDAETSHVPTTQDNSRVPQAIIPLFEVREREFMLGSSGCESRGQVRLLLQNTEGLYTTALQLLTNTMSHVC